MKFWQKIFVAVFLLFFVFFNGGMIAMSRMYYEANLESEKRMAQGGAFFVSESLWGEFANLDRLHVLGTDNKKRVFQTLSLMYQRRDIYLQYMEDDKLLFDSLGAGDLQLDWTMAEEETLLFEYQGTQYYAVRTDLTAPVENAALLYLYSLEQFETTWSHLIRAFIAAEICLILVLAEILYMVIRQMLKPLYELSDAARRIQEGNYEQQVPVKGRDEIAKLTENFNQMSQKVSESIEELRESDTAKQHFIDDLGHELRTPLTSIYGYAEYLKMTDVSEEEKQISFGYILSESRRLQKLSDTLLNLALVKNEAIRMEPVSVEQLFTRMQQMFDARCKEKQVHLLFRKQGDTIWGNEDLLYSLLTNLIENSLRAIENEGTIEVIKDQTDQAERITVRDNGIGMEAGELKRITEPFYRVDKARSRKSGGVGLGLSLCRRIVEYHKGSISYESAPGEGTCVTVLLQLEHNLDTKS